MALVVSTGHSLEAVESEIIRIFSKIKNTGVEYSGFKTDKAPPPFAPGDLGKFVEVVPLNNSKQLKVIFRLPEYSEQKYYKSGEYLRFLFGHKGKGSLLGSLMEAGLANDLTAAFQISEDYFSELNLAIELTPRSATKAGVLEVLGCLGAFTQMLRELKPQRWIYHELKTASELKFLYGDTDYDVYRCLDIVCDIFYTPHRDIANSCLEVDDLANVLYHEFEYRGFQPEIIEEMTSKLNPQHLILVFQAPQDRTGEEYLEDPIFKTKYSVTPIGVGFIQAYNNGDIESRLKNHFAHSFV